MKIILIALHLIIFSVSFSQNTVEYSRYSMENPNKLYKIVLGYDNEPSLTDVLIGSQSDDTLFDKSTIIFDRYQFYAFIDYLDFLINKKNEWDKINVIHKTPEITKTIDYDNKNLIAGCVYENGPTVTQTRLYAIYSFRKGNSSLQISTNANSKVNSSFIFFPSSKSLETFRDKLTFDKLEDFVKEEYRKQSLLK